MARNTRTQIADAWRRLVLVKELDSITIQELTDEANVNKKTFYYHFHSMADLLKWMYSEKFYEMVDEEGITTDNSSELMTRVMSSLRKNLIYFSSIIGSKYETEFWATSAKLIEYGMEKFVVAMKDKWEEENKTRLHLTDQQMNYLIRYHSMAFYGIAEQWFRSGLDLPDSELLRIYNELSNESISIAFTLMNNANKGDLS